MVLTPSFLEWLAAEPEARRRRSAEALVVLEVHGPALGRPYADTIKGSKLTNLKELRISIRGSPYRLFYAFDPDRRAIVLCGGNKAGDRRFYPRLIPLAEAAFATHLQSLRELDPGESP